MESAAIQTAQQMRVKHFPSESIEQYKGQNDYLQYLVSKGVSLNPKLFPSIFHLKNGLPFIGMAVKQVVGGGQVLIRVPQQIILSSIKAAQQPLLKEVFSDKFFMNEDQAWEDRVLIVYSLFLMQQKDQKNPWFQMIRRFPKQCDITCFWPKEQIEKFRDKTIKSAAAIELKCFEDQWTQFESIKAKYEILQSQEYSKQNYKTVYINLTNRSFGKYINFSSFVPMAQLFNHHCSKVFYTTQTEKRTTFLEQTNEGQSETSSIGSCESNEFIQVSEYAYENVQVSPFKEQIQQSINLDKQQSDKVKAQVADLFQKIQSRLNWQNFSVIFAGHLIYLTKHINRVYLTGNKPFERTLIELKTIGNALQNFVEQAQLYFERVNKKSYWAKKEDKKNKQQSFSYPAYKKQYQSLVIKTSKSDRTEPNNQIYFRYGVSSNRTLLMHYGFAIEGNKYENLKISFNIAQIIGDYSGVLQKVMEKLLSLERKFKLYNHRLNIDMIIFFRLSNWQFYGQKAVDQIFAVVNIDKEIAILQQIVSILQQNLEIYDGDYDLTDKSLNYHQYFINVYHKQKRNILHKQIKMFGLLINLLVKISQGVSKQEAVKQLKRSQQLILSQYIQTIK